MVSSLWTFSSLFDTISGASKHVPRVESWVLAQRLLL